MAKSRRGRPILGAVCGFFFGICLSVTVLVYAGIALNSILYVILPIGGLLLGILLGLVGPFHRKAKQAATT